MEKEKATAGDEGKTNPQNDKPEEEFTGPEACLYAICLLANQQGEDFELDFETLKDLLKETGCEEIWDEASEDADEDDEDESEDGDDEDAEGDVDGDEE